MKNFRTYQIAVELYRLTDGLSPPRHLRDQLQRAASSVVLNLAEGRGRSTVADRRRFYVVALGSLRECQAILDLSGGEVAQVRECADKLGAHLFRLIERCVSSSG